MTLNEMLDEVFHMPPIDTPRGRREVDEESFGSPVRVWLPGFDPYETVEMVIVRNLRSHKLEVAIESYRDVAVTPDSVPDRIEIGPLASMAPTLIRRYGEWVIKQVDKDLVEQGYHYGVRLEVTRDLEAGRDHSS